MSSTRLAELKVTHRDVHLIPNLPNHGETLLWALPYIDQTMNAGSCRLNHVAVSVPDIEAAIKWYVAVFGLRLISPVQTVQADPNNLTPVHRLYGQEIQRFKMAVLSAGTGNGLEIFEFQQPKYSGPQEPARFGPETYTKGGFFHASFTTPDIQKQVEVALELEGSLVGELFDLGRGNAAQFVQDPWGNTFELLTCSLAELFSDAS